MSWFSALSVRARTLLFGSVLSIALVAVGALVPIPYVALGPGVTYNTLGDADGTEVISFAGKNIPAAARAQRDSAGHLNMTTVSVYDHQSLFQALGLWAQGRYSLVPREEVFAPDKTVEQVNQENAKQFADSQSAAETAALRYLKYPSVVYAGTIPATSPAAAVLDPQDRITAVDGAAVTDFASLQARLAGTRPGQVAAVTVLRGQRSETVKVTLAANAQVGPQGFLGIGPVERPLAPFSISISLAGIGGPSAGLMFTLGVIDRLTTGDLTGGHFIAGTGTMEVADDKGTVGPIGGILLKLIAAREAGATDFLVPADNCSEALTRVPAGLRLDRVSTLDNAMTAVRTIAAGGAPVGC